jgi:hypothetical protein
MQKVFKSIFFTGVIALLAVLLTSGMASAVTEVTNVQPNADYQNGSSEIVIDASIVCENIDDLVVFEAVQTQGRHMGIGVLEVECSGAGTLKALLPYLYSTGSSSAAALSPCGPEFLIVIEYS